MGNKNSSSSKSKVHGQKAPSRHVPRQGKLSSTQQVTSTTNDEYISKHNNAAAAEEISRQHGIELYSHSLENDDTFSDFIRRARNKIRTVSMSRSNVCQKQIGNTPPAPQPDEAYSKENQKDEFSEFIQLAKKRLRTSSIGENGSIKRG